MADPYKSLDILPAGTPVPDGYAGATFARDHDAQGFYLHGPRPSPNPLARLQSLTASQPHTLPPDLAALSITRAARRTILKRSIAIRQAAGKSKLAPLVLGKKRYAAHG